MRLLRCYSRFRGNDGAVIVRFSLMSARWRAKNLTQRRKDAIVAMLFQIFYPVIPAFHPVIPAFSPVIPAKAGIQRVAAKFAIRNQVQITAGGSPLPLWERARVRVTRVSALRAGRPRSQGADLTARRSLFSLKTPFAISRLNYVI